MVPIPTAASYYKWPAPNPIYQIRQLAGAAFTEDDVYRCRELELHVLFANWSYSLGNILADEQTRPYPFLEV